LTIAAALDFDPYGRSLGAVSSAVPAFAFQGKYQDAETGLVYFGFRWYDPATAKWLSSDPIQEAGGLNLYAFCQGDPVNGVEYLGMSEEQAQQVGGLQDSLNSVLSLFGVMDSPWAWCNPVFKLQHEMSSSIRNKSLNIMQNSLRAGSDSYVVSGYTGFVATAFYDVIPVAGSSTRLIKGDTLDEQGMIAKTSGFQQGADIVAIALDLALLIPGKGQILNKLLGRVKTVGGARSPEKVLYIGKLGDLEGIPPSQTLLPELPNLGSPKANYYQNMSVLRRKLLEGYEVRDASKFRLNSDPDPLPRWLDRKLGQSGLGAERNLLKNKGLSLNPVTGRYE
jgi:RHS repeat-associated protein